MPGTPPINIRQQICTKINTLLKTVKTTAGYETDMGNRVYEWLSYPLDEEALTACSFKDTDLITKIGSGHWKHTLTVEVLLFANTPATIRLMIADCIKAFGKDLEWGALARSTDLIAETNGVEQKNKKILVANLTFVIVFHTAAFDSYA